MPTFIDDGVVVNESLAALLYLQDKYPEPSLLPNTVEKRALVCTSLLDSSDEGVNEQPGSIMCVNWFLAGSCQLPKACSQVFTNFGPVLRA